MFEKNMKIAYLLDFYGDVLDGHTGTIMRAYYEDDLSLAEIAEGEGISRQGVRHVIKKGEEELCFLEERLGLAKHHSALEDVANALTEVKAHIGGLDFPDREHVCAVLMHAVNTILNKGV